MRVFCATPVDIRERWADFAPLLARLRPEWTVAHLREQMLKGRLQLWGIRAPNMIHSITLTRIDVIDGKRLARIIATRTESHLAPETHAALLQTIGQWACERGCAAVQLIGRQKGLRRWLRRAEFVAAQWPLPPLPPPAARAAR